MPRYWGISLGEGGRYVSPAEKGNYIAIGWDNLGDLSWLRQAGQGDSTVRDKFTDWYKHHYKSSSAIKVGLDTGQIWNFVVRMSQGDVVLVRDPARRLVHIGRIEGKYEYRDTWNDGCPYRYRRSIAWLRKVSRDDLSQKLKDSMGSLLTIINVNKHSTEVESLLTGLPPEAKSPYSVTGPQLRKALIQRLLDLSPAQFEEFITNLLDALGFQTTTTNFVGDKGVDVVGTLNVESLASVDLKVQVKRYGGGSIGIDEVLKLRGTLGPDEHGALVTTTRFTKQARQEAQELGKKPITLVDGDELVDLILKHFDELDTDYQAFLGLQRKQVPLEEGFVLVSQS